MRRPDEGLARKAQKAKDGWRFRFRFLVRQEEDVFVAYCLELDLVATGKTEEEALTDLRDITVAQVSYCIAHDNMDRLFRRAPEEIWEEYYACEKSATLPPRTIKAPSRAALMTELLPFSFTASACRSQGACHAV